MWKRIEMERATDEGAVALSGNTFKIYVQMQANKGSELELWIEIFKWPNAYNA